MNNKGNYRLLFCIAESQEKEHTYISSKRPSAVLPLTWEATAFVMGVDVGVEVA